MLSLLAALALAEVPQGFAEVRRDGDCVVYKGPSEGGPEPMLAECRWPDVAPDALIARLSDYEAYDDLIFGVDTSVVVRREGARALVHQVQSTRGIATREVLIWMATEAVEGGARVAWQTAGDEPLDPVAGRVRATRNDGAWEVRADPAGGSAVTHRIAYDPGGSVPTWVVRWFQVGGMLQVMAEVREACRGT